MKVLTLEESLDLSSVTENSGFWASLKAQVIEPLVTRIPFLPVARDMLVLAVVEPTENFAEMLVISVAAMLNRNIVFVYNKI